MSTTRAPRLPRRRGCGQEHATRAIATAEGAVAGSRAVDLDRDGEETFEVTVQADEVENEVTVSIDGSRVVEQEDDGDVDEEDRERLTTATVTVVEALETAMSGRSGGVTEIDLDTRTARSSGRSRCSPPGARRRSW